ncbi:MAG TPA: VanZ family protein [Candidatus Cloacimonadota bacterium]|nr:VanZ family protein [Candidatus Cloacimonadota bacterium]
MKNPRKFYKTMFYVWGILILAVSSLPHLQIPIPSRFTPDKVAHFLEYFIFSILFYLYLFHSSKSERRIFLLTLLLIIFAYLDELHQKLIPGRQYSLLDFSADFLGIMSGWSILYIMKRKRETE